MEENEIVVMPGLSDNTAAEEELEEPYVPNNPLNRPKMNYIKPIVAILVYVAQLLLLVFLPDYSKWWMTLIVLTGYSLIYFCFIAKRTVIWLVHLYQNKAPDHVRLRCVMEPSCSEYMILAVEKYGVIRGVIKGIGRLNRCGKEKGEDYP